MIGFNIMLKTNQDYGRHNEYIKNYFTSQELFLSHFNSTA